MATSVALVVEFLPVALSRRRSFVTLHVINQAPVARPWNVIGNAGETPVGRSFDCGYIYSAVFFKTSLMLPLQRWLIIGRKSLVGLEIKKSPKFQNNIVVSP